MANEAWGRFWRDWVSQGLAAGTGPAALRPSAVGPWLLGWASLCLALGMVLYAFGGYHAGFHAGNALAPTLPDAFWQTLTELGDERLAIAAAPLFARRYPQVFWALMLAGLLGVSFTHILKPLLAMPRPPAVLDPSAFHLTGPGRRGNSFPSGHSLTAAVFAGVWIAYLRGWGWRLSSLLVACGVAASRVVVGVHWPLDVLAGLSGGAVAAWAGVHLSRHWRWGLTPRGHLLLLIPPPIAAVSLLHDDAGYPQAAWLQWLVAAGGLAWVFRDYLLRPWRAWKARV